MTPKRNQNESSKPRRFSPRARIFIDELVRREATGDGSVQDAARVAGYSISNAYRTFHRPDIQAAVRRKRLEYARTRAAELHEARLRQSWIARGNIVDFVRQDVGGNPVLDDNGLPVFDFSTATPEQIYALSAMEIEDGKVRLKLDNRPATLAKIIEYLDPKPTRHEHSGPGGGSIPIEVDPSKLNDLADDEVKSGLATLWQLCGGRPDADGHVPAGAGSPGAGRKRGQTEPQ